MSDYNQTAIGSGYNSTSAINSELEKVETAVNSKLDKSGGTMTGGLDMNSKKITNVPDGTSAKDAVNYGQLINGVSFAAADAKFYDTVALAQADSTLSVGDVIIIKERANALFDVITATTNNGWDSIDGTASSVTLSLRKSSVWNVLQFGADNTGATDNQFLFRYMLEESSSANASMYFPAGEYLSRRLDLYTNNHLFGDGYKSIIKFRYVVDGATTTEVLFRSLPPTTALSDNRENLHFHDLQLRGTCDVDGFSEFRHLISLAGITNCLIERVFFNGFQGDGVVVTPLNTGYQNFNLTVRDCIFDGINQENRQALSSAGCDGMLFENNWVKNTTKSNMPGAVDLEPNPGYTYSVFNNVRIIGNYFENIGGNVGCITGFYPEDTRNFTQAPRGITIKDNTMDGVYRGIFIGGFQDSDIDDSVDPIDYYVENNKVYNATDRGFWIYGVRGVVLKNNYFESCANTSRIGWTDTFRKAIDIQIEDNHFRFNGTTDGIAIAIYSSDRIDISKNTFDNIGVSGGGFGVPITISTGTSSKVKINSNSIINNLGRTTAAVTVTGVLTAGDNQLTANDFDGLASTSFVAELTDDGENTVTTGVVATTGGQSTATQLTTAMNVVSTASAFDSVKLPTATGDGKEVIVNNRSGVSIQVYPSSGDDLGTGVNAPESIATGASKAYKTYDTGNWIKVTS